jgi:hypothetical protein
LLLSILCHGYILSSTRRISTFARQDAALAAPRTLCNVDLKVFRQHIRLIEIACFHEAVTLSCECIKASLRLLSDLSSHKPYQVCKRIKPPPHLYRDPRGLQSKRQPGRSSNYRIDRRTLQIV